LTIGCPQEQYSIVNRVCLQKSAYVRLIISEAIIIQAGLGVKSSAGEHIGIIYVARFAWHVTRVTNCRLAEYIVSIALDHVAGGRDPRTLASPELGRKAIALQTERMAKILRNALANLNR